MTSLLSRTLLAALALAVVGALSPASADTAIGVVNIQNIMRDSKAAASVRAQLQTKQKSFQSELGAKEKQLLAEEQALVKQRSDANKEEFEKKVKDFRA